MGSNRIALAVETVFDELDEHITNTTSKTCMKCSALCNLCCSTTHIEASPIEFIPLAKWLYEQGMVDDFLVRLEKSEKTGHCPLFLPEAWMEGKGGCLHYEKRGLVCRLFGFGYRLDREGIAELVTCKVMKKDIPEAVGRANRLGVEKPDALPIFRNYSMQLYSIDPDLAVRQLPINKAIRIAIEKLHFQYTADIDIFEQNNAD